MIRKIFLSILIVFLVLLIWNWSLVWYGLNQGYGQLKIIWNAKPIEEVLSDPEFPDSLKSRLHLIAEVRKFAIDSLGLVDTDNYTTLFDQKGEEIMWVVTACEQYAFKPKTWDFPILGKVPYKGFFDKEKAVALARQLEKKGWDVGLRNPGGWSTLGWFTDPILSGMLDRGDGDLASLIMHEMVHSTLFIKDSVEFNENLASFISDSAAYQFLAYKYGLNSEPYQQYLDEDRDHGVYSRHVLRGAHYLDSLYNSFSEHVTIKQKDSLKTLAIERIINTMDTLTLRRYRIPKRFHEKLPNNDYFINYRRYQSKQSQFREILLEKCDGDLKKMIADYRSKYPSV